jgi:hypothetical protein
VTVPSHPAGDGRAFAELVAPLDRALAWRLRIARARMAHVVRVASPPALALAAAGLALVMMVARLDDVHHALHSWRFVG